MAHGVVNIRKMQFSNTTWLTELTGFNRATSQKFCRDFGLLFSALSLVLGVWQPRIGMNIRPGFIALSLALFLVGFFSPDLLRPVASLWRALSVLLHLVVSPIALAALYFVALTPIGIVLRLAQWDPLQLRLNSKKDATYWRTRNPPGPSAESFKQQF